MVLGADQAQLGILVLLARVVHAATDTEKLNKGWVTQVASYPYLGSSAAT